MLWLHPKTALLDKERDALNLYLDTGGRLLIAAQAGAEGPVNALLGGRGLRLRSGVVVDPDVSGTADVQGDPAVMIAAYTDHPIVARLAASRGGPCCVSGADRAEKQRSGPSALAAASRDWVEADPMSRVWNALVASRPTILAAVWSRETRQLGSAGATRRALRFWVMRR